MKVIELPCVEYGRLTGNGGYVTNHENTNYHKKAAAQAMAFIESMEHPERNIDQVLDKTLKESVEKNRQILVPIINTIVLAGRLGLSLRGHSGFMMQWLRPFPRLAPGQTNRHLMPQASWL